MRTLVLMSLSRRMVCRLRYVTLINWFRILLGLLVNVMGCLKISNRKNARLMVSSRRCKTGFRKYLNNGKG
jgi:hypothetical protein